MKRLVVSIGLLVCMACSSTSPVSTSADNATLSFLWPADDTHEGLVLRLQGGGTESIPSLVTLVDPDGQEVASVYARIMFEHLCPGEDDWGVSRAEMLVPPAHAQAFQGAGWPAGYQLVGLLGSDWRKAELIQVDCG